MLRRLDRYLLYIWFIRRGFRPLRWATTPWRGTVLSAATKSNQKTRLKGFPLEKPDSKVCCCIRSEFAIDMIGAVRLRKADKICSLGDAYGILDELSDRATRCPLRRSFIAPISAESADGKICFSFALFVTNYCFVSNPNIRNSNFYQYRYQRTATHPVAMFAPRPARVAEITNFILVRSADITPTAIIPFEGLAPKLAPPNVLAPRRSVPISAPQ